MGKLFSVYQDSTCSTSFIYVIGMALVIPEFVTLVKSTEIS